ncbi:MAG: recombinase family protein [Streptosporangiaceae bacterium]
MTQADALVPVVSYARISADLKRDEHGVQDQHKVNTETAARYGWRVVHEFTDNDKSAAKITVIRDAFEEMLRVVRVGKLADATIVQGVVVVAEDRLARRPGDYERFVDAITYRDGCVYADQRGPKDLYNPDVENMGLVGAAFAKREVQNIQRRMRRSHRARAEQGRPVGGPRPFGWHGDRVTLDPREADLLRQAAKEFLGGRSLHSIVTEWQRFGVKTSLGNDWTTRSLKVSLSSPRICGLREIGGELVRDSDGNPVRGQWATILPPEDWTAIRAIFDGRKGYFVGRDMKVGRPHPVDYRDPAYLLSGILRCGRPAPGGTLCNTPLRVNLKKGATHHAYTCLSKAEGGCGGVSRRGDLVDLYISEAVLAKLGEAQFTAPDDSAEWPAYQELAEAMSRREKLIRRYAANDVSSEAFYRLLPLLEQAINHLRAETSKHQASVKLRQARAMTDVAEIRRRWFLAEQDGGLPISTKRTYVREALHAVIVHPAGKGRKDFDPDLLEPIWRED